MVNPDFIRTVQTNSITTPDKLRVQLGDMNVLDDNVANTVLHLQSLATDDTSTANTNDRLVRGNSDALETSLVVVASGGRVRATPVRVVNGILAGAAASVGLGDAALAVRTLAFTGQVVEFLVDENDTRSAVAKPLSQLSDIARRGGRGTTTTCCSRCEAYGAARHTCSLCMSAKEGNGCNQGFDKQHCTLSVYRIRREMNDRKENH